LKADPARRERINQQKRAIEAALDLGRLREARSATQRELAERLDVSQANISRIEHEEDVYVSTLRSYVEALGGRLELRAVFDDAIVELGPNGILYNPIVVAATTPSHSTRIAAPLFANTHQVNELWGLATANAAIDAFRESVEFGEGLLHQGFSYSQTTFSPPMSPNLIGVGQLMVSPNEPLLQWQSLAKTKPAENIAMSIVQTRVVQPEVA
jgi:transcriptional regulator with XRE-family HTH domain